ncbi:MAG: alpha/beta fold hydrolase [Candidatus Acidiferrales bacterium]
MRDSRTTLNHHFGTYIAALAAVIFVFVAIAEGQVPSAPNPFVQEGYLTGADNVHLFYRKVGDGNDFIVLLHGGPGASMANGEFLGDAFAGKKRAVIMYDQRGGGRSEVVKDPSMLTAASHARDLEALREHFHIQKMSLIGISWGSGLAALYADAHPERVGRIVFLDPMWPANKPYAQQRSERIESLIAPKDAARLKEIENEWGTASDDRIRAMCVERFRILLGPYLFNPSSYDTSRPEATIVGREIAGLCGEPPAAIRNLDLVADAVMSSLGDFDFRPMLARLKVPVLVVEGEKTNVPLDATREWVKAIPGARLLLIPDAGHMALEEKPEAAQEIAAFLSGKWPPSANEIKGSR